MKAIILNLSAWAVLPFMDTIAKYLSAEISFFQITWARYFFTVAWTLPFMFFFFRKNLKWSENPKLQILRGTTLLLANVCFFYSISVISMAKALTLAFVAPLVTTALSPIFLKEKVGIRRWTAVVIGFIGVVIVINPQREDFNFIFILPIFAAIFLTIRDIATKGIVTKTNNFEIIFITSILITFFSGMSSIYTGFDISLNQLPNIFISSIFLTVAYLFSVMTIFYAPLSLTASSRYSVIIFGIIFGYLLLNEIPGINMIIGATIITASGLFVIKREKDLGKIN